MEFLFQQRLKLIAGGLALGALGLWYFSDLASNEHHPSTIKAPSKSDPEYTNYFINKKNMWIYTKSWLPEQEKPVGLIFLVHGHGEHISRKGYDNFANLLTQAGYAVFGLDHQGHGKSNGSRGHVRQISDLCEDLEQFVEIIKQRYPCIPTFALGHSMGGLVPLTSVIHHPNLFHGIILSAPAACMHMDPRIPESRRVISSLAVYLAPKYNVIRLPLDGLSRNNSALEAYLADPLINHGLINLSSVYAISQGSRNLWDKLHLIKIPLLIVHGKGDTIVYPIGSQYIYKRAGSADKVFMDIPDVKHEFWEDPDKSKIFAQIIEWLNNRID